MEPHTGLNNLDYIVLGIILLSGILALFRGFVREVFSLIAWTAAYFIAAEYHGLVEPLVHHYIKGDVPAHYAAIIGLFLIVLITLTILGIIVAGLIKGQALTAIDRSLGLIFGLLRGVLVVCIVYLAAVAIWWPNIDKPPSDDDKDKSKPPEWLMEARTRPMMARGSAMLKAFIPEKDIEEQAKSFVIQKVESQHDLNQKALDMMSTPTATSGKDVPVPTYDDKSRSGLDQLINQKAKP